MQSEAKAPFTPNRWAYLEMALWCGLFSGLAEVMWRLFEKHMEWRWFLRQSQDFMWLTPVTDAVVFIIPGLLLVGLSFLFRGRRFVLGSVLVMCMLLTARILMIYGRLDDYAIAALSLGVGVQLTRLVMPRLAELLPIMRRSLIVMVALVVFLAGARYWFKHSAEQRQLAALPPAKSGAPNILFITLDTVRAENMSLYGYARRTTPKLEEWAKKGTTFNEAFVPAPWTLPSHASMFTGRYPHELSSTWRIWLDSRYPTVTETLRDQGYLTAGFVANRYYAGWDSGISRGFTVYEDYKLCPEECINLSGFTRWLFNKNHLKLALNFFDLYGRKNAAEVNAEFLDWVGSEKKDRPFFAFLNYFDAHDPYLPPEPFDRMFGPAPSAEDKSKFTRKECCGPTIEDKTLISQWWQTQLEEEPKERIDMAVTQYDGAIAYLDDQFGKLMDELQRRGILQNTLVVVTSDHGEQFGEHKRFIHGNSLYRPLLHVPLLMIYPEGVPAGTRVTEPVTLRDLPATMLDIVNAENAGRIPGNSLADLWTEQTAGKTYNRSPLFACVFRIPPGAMTPDHGRSPTATGCLLSLYEDGKYYIKQLSSGREEIYDWKNDPRELVNLAESKDHVELLPVFRQRVEKIFEEYPSFYVDFPYPK